ncbi:LPXTG cell wall anchor domain-containing protein [Enterococcus faecalis]
MKYQQLPQTGEKQYSTLPLAGGILLVFLFGLILKKKQS